MMIPAPLLVLRDSDPLGTGIKILVEKHLHALPVVDAAGRYLGLFDLMSAFRAMLPAVATFEGDLVDLGFVADSLDDLCDALPSDRPVGEFLSDKVPQVSPDLSLKETLLLVFRCRCALPVVDPATGKLVGMVSPWGALAAIERRKEARP